MEAGRVRHRLKLYCHLVVDTRHDVLELQMARVFAYHVTQRLDEPGSARRVSPRVVACRRRRDRANTESGGQKAGGATSLQDAHLALWRRRKGSRLPRGSWWIHRHRRCRFPRLRRDQCHGMPAQGEMSRVKVIFFFFFANECDLQRTSNNSKRNFPSVWKEGRDWRLARGGCVRPL